MIYERKTERYIFNSPFFLFISRDYIKVIMRKKKAAF